MYHPSHFLVLEGCIAEEKSFVNHILETVVESQVLTLSVEVCF